MNKLIREKKEKSKMFWALMTLLALLINQGEMARSKSREEVPTRVLNIDGALGSGGGDSHAVEFVATALSIFKNLSTNNELKEYVGVEPADLKETIESTQVESTTDELRFEGVIKDAIYDQQLRKIRFNSISWDRMSDAKRKMLSFHEYLGIMKSKNERYNDVQYLISSKLFSFDATDPLLRAKHLISHIKRLAEETKDLITNRSKIFTKKNDRAICFSLAYLGEATEKLFEHLSIFETQYQKLKSYQIQNDLILNLKHSMVSENAIRYCSVNSLDLVTGQDTGKPTPKNLVPILNSIIRSCATGEKALK